MYKMKAYSLALLLLTANLISFAQESKIDTISEIKASRIKPSTKKYIQYIENTDGTIKFNSILSREIQEIEFEGQKVYLIIQKYQSENGIDIDSSLVRKMNLMPIAYHSDISTEGHKEIVKFSETQISNRIVLEDSTYYSVEPNKNLYNSVIINEVISELPLEIGKNFIIKMVNPGKRFYEYITSVQVLKIESIELNPSVRIKCWKLNVKYGNSTIGNTEWYSVKKQIQIKSLFEYGDNKKFVRNMIVQ